MSVFIFTLEGGSFMPQPIYLVVNLSFFLFKLTDLIFQNIILVR